MPLRPHQRHNIPQASSLFRQAAGEDATASALRAASVTVAQRFTTQLNSLIQTLQGSNVRFVRCIKSNHQLQPQRMDKPSVLQQLICSGVMAALEVRRAGFPTRVQYAEFVQEFRAFSVGFPTRERERGEHEERLKEHRTERQLEAAAAAAAAVTAQGPKKPETADGEATEQEEGPALEEARPLTARMMLHPAVLAAISARQYRLGVSKLFLQADALAVLQSVRNRMILPQVQRLQRWWIRLSESALAHKLKRAAGGLKDAKARAELAGVHQAGAVHRALQECEAAVQYARGLGSLHPEVFRPAVNKACQRVQALEDLLLRTLAVKEREQQQRAELLEMLDKGRAHLAHVQQGLRGITLAEGAAVRKLADRAGQGLSKRSQELLRFAAVSGAGDAAAAAALAAAAAEEDGDREAALRLQRRKVEEVLGWIKDAEQAFERVTVLQQQLEEARAGATEKLAGVRSSLRQATKAAEAAGVQGAVGVQQQLTAAREQMQAAEAAVAGHDAAAFGHAVERVRLTVSELAHVVEEERRRKEDQDLRAEGQALLDAAGKRLQALKAEAASAGVKPALAGALKALESELAAAAALAMASDSHAYVAACRKAGEEGVEALAGALKAEKLTKQRNDEQRQAELARLAPRAAALQEVQAAIQAQLELASEEELCHAVASAVAALGDVKAALAKSPAVASLRERVDAALLQGTEAERLFAEVRQRHEFRARELEAARAQLETLSRRLKALLTAHGLGDDDRSVGGQQEQQVLAALVAGAMARAQEVLGALERDVGQWSGSPEDALRVRALAASETLDELEEAVQAQQQRLELVGKARQDEAARLKLAKDRFQAFLAAEVYGGEAAASGLEKEEGKEEEGEAPSAATARAAAATATASTAPRLCDKAGVRATIAATEVALRRADERVRGGVSLAWLEREEASRQEERRMVSEAVASAASVQAFLAEEGRRHERWLRQCRANQTGAEAARARLVQLRELVAGSGVSHVRRVQAAVEACECTQDLVGKLLAQSTRCALHDQRQEGGDEEGDAAERNGLTLQTERAIAALVDRVKEAEALVESHRAQREAEEGVRAETQGRFEAVLLRYQGVVGMVEAAGPVVKRLCQGFLDEASATVNQAAHWVRRGTARGAADADADADAESEAATTTTAKAEPAGEDALVQLAAKIAEAAAQVDVLEAEGQAIISRVERATRLRVSEGKRLAALGETLALCGVTAEKRGVHRAPAVARPLRRAREALGVAKLKLEGEDLLEMWGDMAAAVAAQVEEAARLVGELEETVDREAQTRERAGRDVASARRTFVGLAERHALAKRTAEEAGVAHAAAIAAVVSAADGEVSIVRQALEGARGALEEGGAAASSAGGFASLLEALSTCVVQEEAAVDEEARRLRARETEVQQAARDLALMVERMDRLELVLRAAASLEVDEAAGKEKDGSGEAEDKRDVAAAGGVAAVLMEAPLVREALEEAKRALQRIQRSVADDDGADGAKAAAAGPIPSTEAAMSLVRAAEEAVQEQAARLRGAKLRRAESVQRMRVLERSFTDLQEKVGAFCARSAHTRMQLEAGVGEGQRCWWNTQTGASQVADGGSAASAAAMAAEPITTVQLLVEGVAAAEAAMGRAKQRLYDDKSIESSPAAAMVSQALDEALLRIERAAELLEAEKARVEREEEERLAALRSLDQLGDRVERVKVVAEARELEGVAAVTEALEAAELAVGVVSKLLAAGRGAPSVALPALDVARRRVQEAEEVVGWEVQRRLRRERECAAAKEELAGLRLRSEALRQVVKEFGFGEVTPVRNGLEEVGRALERAEVALANTAGTTAIATVHAEVRRVGQRLEASERAIRRERIRHEERQRAAQQKEEEARLRTMREADEERRKGEKEKLKRSQLDVELEKLLFRLSMHRPTLDSIQADMARAEEAAKSARHRLAEGDITDAQVATETAYCLAESFEHSITSLRNGGGGGGGAGGGLLGRAIAEEEGEKESQGVAASALSTTPVKPPPALPPMAAPRAPSADTAVAAAGFQAYMEKTTATLDTMAQSIQTLMYTVTDLNTSVLKQRRKLDEHSEVLASPDKLVTPTRGLGGSNSNSGSGSRSRPSSAFAAESPALGPASATAAARREKATDEIGRSLAPSLVDEGPGGAGPTDKGAGGRDGIDASATSSIGTSQGEGGGKWAQEAAAAAATAVIKDEARVRRQLRGRDGSEELYQRLARFATRNGVTIEDCIKRGTTEDNTLEMIAGDADSYTLFAPVFMPTIIACQPKYTGPDQRQPIDLDPARLLPEVAKEKARCGEPGYAPGDVSSFRVVVGRNLAGRVYSPLMSVEQLREVERLVVPQLEKLTGRVGGSYTRMVDVLADKALLKELSCAGMPVQQLGSQPHWPEGRGVFLSRDRALCIIINIEDHISVISTARSTKPRRGNVDAAAAAEGPAALLHRAFAVASEAAAPLAKALRFDFDKNLGYLTPSPAKLGTAFTCSATLATPATPAAELETEQRFLVSLQDEFLGNRATLGCSEADIAMEVLHATRFVVEGAAASAAASSTSSSSAAASSS